MAAPLLNMIDLTKEVNEAAQVLPAALQMPPVAADQPPIPMAAAPVPMTMPQKIEWIAKHYGPNIASFSTQCIIHGDQNTLKGIERHPMNRLVDMSWVNNLKSDMLTMIMNQEIIMMDIAINTNDIVIAENDGDKTQIMNGFKAIILDGQHRTEALKMILKESPALKFSIIYRVFLVESDAQIIDRIHKLNKRRAFDQNDTDKQYTVANFLAAMTALTSDSDMNHRQYTKMMKKSKILNDLAFINKHKNKSIDNFKNAILRIAAKYKPEYDNQIATNAKFSKSALCKLIHEHKMYQFILDPTEWMSMIA